MEKIKLDLSFKYENSNTYAINKVNARIDSGKVVVLCGHSGCGKSSLLRSINHLIPDFYEGKMIGGCFIDGKDTRNLKTSDVGQMVSSVFQDPRSQFFTLNSSLEVAFGLENFGYSHEEIVKRVDDSFKTFNLEYLKNRDVFSLSSGERQLVAILQSYALDCDILVLDEPTANLDYNSIIKLKEMLEVLKEKGKTIIISEHRLYYLQNIADYYYYIYKGKLEKVYDKDEFNNLPGEYLKKLGLRIADIKRLNDNISNFKDEKMINTFKCEHVRYKYKKYKEEVLKDINISCNNNDIVGIVGQNGSGKTTFGKVSTGLLKEKTSKFYLNDKLLKVKELKENSIFIMQEAEFQFFTNSVINELTFNKVKTKELMDKIEVLLKKVNMWELRNKHPFSLSGGQMQKLVLLIAYFSNKKIVFLDEPTAGLDYKSLMDVIDIINEMKKEKIVFIITHDLELIKNVVTKVYLFKDGIVNGIVNLKVESINKVKAFMELKQIPKIRTKKVKKKPMIDPRIKIIVILTCMILGIFVDINLMMFSILGLLILCLYEHKFLMSLISASTFIGLYLLYYYLPNPATIFMMNFFPRIILIGTCAYLIVRVSDAPYFIAGLRKLRVPEKVIMVGEVIFRFFPVLSGDLKIMNASLNTRKVKKSFIEKIKGIPAYVEVMIVPMVFRVIRIAETLAASAETRGINYKVKRDIYLDLKLRFIDILLLLIFISLIVVGIIL